MPRPTRSSATRILILTVVAALTLTGFAGCQPGAHADDHGPSVAPAPMGVAAQPLPDDDNSQTRQAVFAGGCFWCIEAVFERVHGVTDVVSGFDGGAAADAHYHTVSAGGTGHAEAVRITYNPDEVTYGQLMRVLFQVIHPTQANGQSPDIGSQYRSTIFYANDAQKRAAQAYIKQLNDAHIYDKKIATTIEPVGKGFFPAEAYHQDYAEKNPNDPYITYWLPGKLAKLHKLPSAMLKEDARQ